MFKKTITYTDYDGNERTEDFRFNLSKAEYVMFENSVIGGMSKEIERAMAMQNGPRILEIFKDLVDRSYGVKTADGRRFMKSPELLQEFRETEAYVNLFMELVTDPEAGKAFLRGVSPSDMIAELDKKQ
jgi:hypothetical protein|uniref:Tail assembly chaperone n=1 Tax=Siphoviridae sp. ct8M020 TaxID=2825362 RepID=A0A8S5PJN1_9CAUD|nr:MAG TPA: hypothetical protein [Siphoviridae sp. ct8M020]